MSDLMIVSFLQTEPVCFAKDFECVNKMKSQLASSNCLKPCAGLTVTGYSKFHGNKNLEDHFPIFAAYNMYKRITDNPKNK